MQAMHSPLHNGLLAALPPLALGRLAEQMELVMLPLGEMLYEPGRQMQHACFPVTAIVSLHYVTESGASAESADIGNEGVVGIALFMGGLHAQLGHGAHGGPRLPAGSQGAQAGV